MLLDRRPDVFLARRSGAEGWLVKPLDPIRLRRATAALLENASPGTLMQIIQQHRATLCFTAATAYRAELMALAIAEGVSRTQLNEGEDDFHCSFWVDSFANRQQFCDRYPDLTPGRIDDNGIWWDIKTVPHNPALPTT